MSVWAIVPVKHLSESKRRLAHVLGPDERAELIYGFLDNLLALLAQSPGIAQALVVTADERVAALARQHGVRLLHEAESRGLNTAVRKGVDMAMVEGATAVLILPADLPFARAVDIEQLLSPLADEPGPLAVICGDEALDGTNALLLSPPGDFEFHYGPGSFARHAAEAARRNRVVRIVGAPGLRFDLDTESDWYVYNGYLVQVADES